MFCNSSIPDPTSEEPNWAAEGRAIGRGALTNLFGIAASSLGFAFYLVAGRLYGAEATGLYLLAWTTLDIISKLGILGLDRALLTLVAQRRAADDLAGVYRLLAEALLIGLLMTGLIGALVLGGAELFSVYVLGKPELCGPLRLMALGLPFWTLSALFVHVARAFRVMRYEIYAKRVAEPLLMLVLAVLGAALGWGQWGLAWAFVLASAAGALVAAFLLQRLLPLAGLATAFGGPLSLRRLFSFCAPIGLYDLLNLLLQRVDLFLIGRFLPASAAGIYGLAQETAFAAKKVRQAFDPIVIPVISGARQNAGRAALQHHYTTVTTWILSVDLLVLGLVFFMGRTLLSFYGGEFVAGALCLVILTGSVVLNGVLGVAELFILLDRPGLNLLNSAVAVLTALGLGLWLTPLWGMEGAALAILGAFLVMNILRLAQVRRLYRLSPFNRRTLLPLLWAALALLVALPLGQPWASFEPPREIAAAALFALIYGGALLLARRSEKARLRTS